MQIARRLFNEFWLPAIAAIAWTVYSAYTAAPVWGLKDYINVFGPSFFLASWATGQFFRVRKQTDVEQKLGSLDVRVENLSRSTEEQTATLKLLLDHVVPQHRANPSINDVSDSVIPLSRVVDFYNAVAPFYNKRNSGKYLATYVEIDAAIRSLLTSIDGISICDIGGGTGTLLQWFLRNDVRWTNVDISQNSLSVFENTKEFAPYKNKFQRNKDARTDQFIEQGERFDVFVMSYLLSSLECLPDLSQVWNGMSENSLLVVADNHFDYVQRNPRYGFEGVGGKTLSIFPRPMFPDDVRSLVQAAGFVEVSYKLVLIDGTEPYSQVHVFKRANPVIESAKRLSP